MKTQFVGMVLASIAINFGRIFGAIFAPTHSASLGAKTGTITAPSGADANMRTLGDSTPVTDTLAGIMRSALGLAAALKRAVINFYARKVVILPTTEDIGAIETTGVLMLGIFQKDDPTKASSPWTFAAETNDSGIEAALTAITEEVKPPMSAESLINKIEDVHQGIMDGDVVPEAGGLGGITLVVDQTSGTITVFKIDSTAHATASIAAGVALAEDATFVQTITGTTGAQFAE